jgi:two-component system nitrogen regulation sensor histidine kinase NtrY
MYSALSAYSFCGILMLCFSFFIFYLLNEVFLTICVRLPVPPKHQLILFGTSILLTTIYYSIYRNEFIAFYLLWSCIVIIRGYAYRYKNGKTTTFMFAGVLFICAVISSVNLNHFEEKKEIKPVKHW